MPEPVRGDRRYIPGLDGLRAIAVLGVLVYHLGFDWLPGGFLGVSVFFTLSGYLITDLILAKAWAHEFTSVSFWLARARRLLPALFLMLLVVMAWVTVVGPHQGKDFRWSAATAAGYVNNWWSVFHRVSYFEQFDLPDPVNHLWSLAVEEQFYILWPLLVMLGLRFIPERNPGVARPRFVLATLALAAISVTLMVVLHPANGDPSRVYYGTDTRAAELLIGAALAAVWPSRLLRANVAANVRNLLDALAVGGLVVIAMMFFFADDTGSFLYHGGFLALSIGVAIAIAAIVHPASRVSAALGCRPMRWIGARSYGIYLWHFPIIILTADGRIEPSLVRTSLQVAATFVVAALSWRFVEDPIRRGALGRLLAQWRDACPDTPVAGVSPVRLTPVPLAAFVGGVVLVVAATAGFVGAGVAPWDDSADAIELEVIGDEETELSDEPELVTLDELDDEATDSLSASVPDTSVADTEPTAAPDTTEREGPDPLTSCSAVTHIGDSTSVGLVSKKKIPEKSQRITAQYTRIGVDEQHFSAAGGRSIARPYGNAASAANSAKRFRNVGFQGCWVFALGTTDASGVDLGVSLSVEERVDRMMKVADGEPVMWVNTKSLLTEGHFRDEAMQEFNQAVLDACARYPNLKIYDWRSDVKDEWFEKDQIHFTNEGWAERARHIADALTVAYPYDTSKVVDKCVIGT